jgi:hypothetical protein
VDVGVLSVSCPGASGAFLAVAAICRINNLRLINMPVWFKSTPTQPSEFVASFPWFSSIGLSKPFYAPALFWSNYGQTVKRHE